ncbi:CAP domain-containing protein [Kitasatospora hibisci]|uniref:CAP domain-containing protein n=1 Tax=Kitasatospora hibisci TaxID=3369522 RepID=UPI0037543C45
MQSIRRRQGLALVVAVGVVAAAASACGPEAGTQASDRSGAVAAAVAPVGGLPSADPASAPSATASAGPPTTATATATASATTPVTATPSKPASTPTAAATKASPGPAAKTPAAATPRPVAATPSPRTAPSTGNAAPDRSAGSAEALSLRLINEERARNGVPALVVKADLTAFAENWARHMRETGFAHSENASGAGPSLTGSRTLTGECIVMWGDAAMTGEQAAAQFQKMWTGSPGHHAAQINPRYKEIGVGFFHDSSGWWGVHEFAG